jgi:acetate kinase
VSLAVVNVIVLNGGSSSLKAALLAVDRDSDESDPPAPLWSEHAELGAGRTDVVRPIVERAAAAGRIDAAGHRVVHGGQRLQQTCRVTAEVKAEIRKFAEFAPEHNGLELKGMDAVEQVLGPDLPQVAVFDTAFHTTMPEAAKVYPGPYSWYERGIRRYGFHGISHQYVSRRAAQMLGNPDLRVITCHLGNGASLAAVRSGRSIDTTMGFTPLDGLMMGTRPGSLDPGIPVYLVRHQGMNATDLDRVLNHESGLKGVSGVSGDMRDVLKAADAGNARAKLAFEVYVHRLCAEIGAMAASLGEVDAVAFTGWVGENCEVLRERVKAQLSFLRGAKWLVIPTNEDWEIAKESYKIFGPLMSADERG